MKYLLLVLTIFIFIPIKAQTASIKGEIETDLNEKIDISTVLLLSNKDSSIIYWDTFFSEKFEFKSIKADSYILRVQNVQFQTLDTLVTICDGENTLFEPLILKGLLLNEVVVSARRPTMYAKNGNLIVDVHNSYLKDESRVSELFAQIPGVEIDASGSISMFGKDNLVIFINERRVVSQEQLKALQPFDIDKIEVIKNVGSEYSANVDGIIKIWTKKNIREKYRVTMSNNTLYSCKWSNDLNISSFFNMGKVSQYLAYQNSFSNGRQFDNNKTTTFLPDYKSINERDVTIDNRNKNHSILYTLEYDITDKNKFGIQYSGQINQWLSQDYGLQIIKHDETEKESIRLDNDNFDKRNLHNVGLNYNYIWDKEKKISLIADYAISHVASNNKINERNVESDYKSYQYNLSKGDYNIFSIQPEFLFVKENNKLTLGAKYSMMGNRSGIYYSSADSLSELKLREHIGALYVNWKGAAIGFNYSIGLRGEFAQTKIINKKLLNGVNRGCWGIFPYLMIGRDFSNEFNASFYYRRRIQRPSFSSLNPTFVYRDSLSYSTGNPYLKPVISDMLTLSAAIYKIDFSIGYYIYHNSIFMEDVQDVTNPSISVSTYGNIKRKNRLLNMNIGYSYNLSKLSGVASLNINKPFLEIPYLDSYKKMNRAIVLFKLSSNWQLLKLTSMSGAYTIRSKGDSKNIQWSSYSKLDFSINQYLFDRNLLIAVSINDVFNRNKMNRWTSYSNKICYIMDSNPDTRYVALTLRYNWGGAKKSIQKKSSNSDSINRM